MFLTSCFVILLAAVIILAAIMSPLPRPETAECPVAEIPAAEQTLVDFGLTGFASDEPDRVRPYVRHMPWFPPGPDLDPEAQRSFVHASAAAEALIFNRLDQITRQQQGRTA